jgi:hypothetical protein
MKISEGLAGPLNDISACLAVVMRCAIDSEDANKEVGTVLSLVHKYLGTSALLVYTFLLILLHNFFVIPVIPRAA